MSQSVTVTLNPEKLAHAQHILDSSASPTAMADALRVLIAALRG